jgi:lipopolysaccharide transport system ATP-binding protein
MYVRLAFAVAAHLEPEILIVDEVLAVGDAEFQKKAIGKMQDVSAGQGRTVLFVSHNMKAVSTLCSRCLLLENGTLAGNGEPGSIVDRYLGVASSDIVSRFLNPSKEFSHGVRLISCSILNGLPIKTTDAVTLTFDIEFSESFQFHLTFHLKSEESLHLFQASSAAFPSRSGKKYKIAFTIPQDLLNEGYHSVSVSFVRNNSDTFFSMKNVLSFMVIANVKSENLVWFGKTPGLLKPKIASHIIGI